MRNKKTIDDIPQILEGFGFSEEEIDSAFNPPAPPPVIRPVYNVVDDIETKTFNWACDIASGIMIGLGILASVFFAFFLFILFCLVIA